MKSGVICSYMNRHGFSRHPQAVHSSQRRSTTSASRIQRSSSSKQPSRYLSRIDRVGTWHSVSALGSTHAWVREHARRLQSQCRCTEHSLGHRYRLRFRKRRVLPNLSPSDVEVRFWRRRSLARPVTRWLSGGRRVGRTARHPDAHGQVAGAPRLFGHRFGIVCLTRLQSRRKCGNTREHGDAIRARDFAAKRPHSPVVDPRLKIVVSPVRVRVSPSNKALQSCGFCT